MCPIVVGELSAGQVGTDKYIVATVWPAAVKSLSPSLNLAVVQGPSLIWSFGVWSLDGRLEVWGPSLGVAAVGGERVITRCLTTETDVTLPWAGGVRRRRRESQPAKRDCARSLGTSEAAECGGTGAGRGQTRVAHVSAGICRGPRTDIEGSKHQRWSTGGLGNDDDHVGKSNETAAKKGLGLQRELERGRTLVNSDDVLGLGGRDGRCRALPSAFAWLWCLTESR